MDRQLILYLLAAAALGFVAILLLMPQPADDGVVRLPWRIEQNPAGRTRVFGLTLGETSLAEVRELFGEEGKLNLFRGRNDPFVYAAEAYFEQIYLARLRADFVFTLDVDQRTLSEMHDRGLRISRVGSGAQKVKLDPADAVALAGRPIRSISYLPQARLDGDLIERRFGTPARRLTEPDTGVVHWLYPERGLDIGRDPKGHVVIQYVDPRDFGRLMAPLATLAQQAPGDGALAPPPASERQEAPSTHH